MNVFLFPFSKIHTQKNNSCNKKYNCKDNNHKNDDIFSGRLRWIWLLRILLFLIICHNYTIKYKIKYLYFLWYYSIPSNNTCLAMGCVHNRNPVWSFLSFQVYKSLSLSLIEDFYLYKKTCNNVHTVDVRIVYVQFAFCFDTPKPFF